MTDVPESFKDFPRSVGEIKAEKAQDGSLWSPRDALIDLLRDIDAGKEVTDLIISFREKTEDGRFGHFYRAATRDQLTALGLLDRVAHIINANS